MGQRALIRICRRIFPSAVSSVLALGLVTGCTGSTGEETAATGRTSSGDATTSAGAPPSTSSSASASARATASPADGGSTTVSLVSCREDACTVTLAGAGSLARVFDTTIAFVAIRDRAATLRVADEEVVCREGAGVAAGPLRLECTGVTEDTVEFTAGPR